MLVERDGRGITKDNQKLSSRGRTRTGTTRNNGNENHFDQKKPFHRAKRKRYATRTESQANQIRAEPREMLGYRTPRHANKGSSAMQTRRRHMACAYAKATYRWTGVCPPCSRTMVNATNANIVTQQRYRRLTRHQGRPKTPEAIAPSR